MNINDVIQMISTLGFPIVMCGALFWKMNEQDKSHEEQNKALTEAVNNNTIAIQRLVDKIGG